MDGLVMTRLGIKSFYFVLDTHMYVYMCGCVYIPGKRYKVSKLAILEPNWTVGCKDDIAQNKDAYVAALVSFSAEGYHWNINFTRPVQDTARISHFFLGFTLFWSMEGRWRG